jgi:hypothetical protein
MKNLTESSEFTQLANILRMPKVRVRIKKRPFLLSFSGNLISSLPPEQPVLRMSIRVNLLLALVFLFSPYEAESCDVSIVKSCRTECFARPGDSHLYLFLFFSVHYSSLKMQI